VDRDLVACADVLTLNELLHADEAWWQPWRGSPLLLCGGTENQLELVNELTRHELLCGLKRDSLLDLRSPKNWARWAQQAGLQWPESHASAQDLPRHPEPSDWLIKSSTGAGGLGVRFFGDDSTQPGDYLQRRIHGRVLGVTFLSCMDRSLIVGCAQSWDSDRFPGPFPFCYRGSVAPIALNEEDSIRLQRFADVVHHATGLLGLWQADFIQDGDDSWWLLEINPRWSSSMELHDSVSIVRLIALHVRAISGTPVREFEPEVLRGRQILVAPLENDIRIGKVIRYAEDDLQPTKEQLQWWWSKRWSGDTTELHLENRIADIPNTTEKIPSGFPIFTEFASGTSVEEVRQRLEESRIARTKTRSNG
jgi:predicted ATP-grasp superfamily ATP-dependent carboligase